MIWQDNRTDDDYGVQFPIGNTLDDEGRAISSGGSLADPNDDIVNSFIASSSTSALSFGGSVKVSSEGHQSAYEMFGNRDIPFHGDYNWISLADGRRWPVRLRDVDRQPQRRARAGPRELDAQDGFDDGFDVHQCRDDLADEPVGPARSRDAARPKGRTRSAATPAATRVASTRTSSASRSRCSRSDIAPEFARISHP